MIILDFLGHFYKIFIENFNHLPDDQYNYCWVKSFNCYNFLFQASDEKIAIEMNQIGEADVKVDSEDFCDVNDDQANNDGNRWIIICLSRILMLYWFYCCFYNLFYEYVFISIIYGSLYSAVFMCFLCCRRRNGIRLWGNWCERRAIVSFIEMWPGLFCVVYGPHVYYRFNIHNLSFL